MSDRPASPLNEFDEIEWFDVARKLIQGLSREDFAVMWKEFQQCKKQKKLH